MLFSLRPNNSNSQYQKNECTAFLLFLSKNAIYGIMSNSLIYAGIVVGVAAIAGIMVFGTASQQDRIPADAVAAPATLEGSFSSPSGLGAELNKEQWREDPFADEAAESKAKSGLG